MPNEKLPSIVVWGRRLLAVFAAGMVIGKVIVELFFPNLLGAGLNAGNLSFLIPLWSIGVGGLLLLLIAWIMDPNSDTELEFDRVNITERRDGQIFSRFTKTLAVLTTSILLLASLLSIPQIQKEQSPWIGFISIYVVICICVWIIYLATFYSPNKHFATNTFQNHFTPFFATLLVPFVWPLLFFFNLGAVYRQRHSTHDDTFIINENDPLSP